MYVVLNTDLVYYLSDTKYMWFIIVCSCCCLSIIVVNYWHVWRYNSRDNRQDKTKKTCTHARGDVGRKNRRIQQTRSWWWTMFSNTTQIKRTFSFKFFPSTASDDDDVAMMVIVNFWVVKFQVLSHRRFVTLSFELLWLVLKVES